MNARLLVVCLLMGLPATAEEEADGVPRSTAKGSELEERLVPEWDGNSSPWQRGIALEPTPELAVATAASPFGQPPPEPPEPPEGEPSPAPSPSDQADQAEAARRFAATLQRRQASNPAPSGLPFGATPTPDPAIDEAIRRYQETGDASVIKKSHRVIYPFNHSQPSVRCSPLRACDVQLEPGELITGVAVGDSERWLASPLTSGDVQRPTPHVILKPREYDVRTNIVIATSRRTYHLDLESPSKGDIEGGDATYHRQVAFYYPEETVQRWAAEEELARRRTATQRAARTETFTASGALDLDGLNFAYSVRGPKKATWVPEVVFDDGHHVYIQLPRHAIAGRLPALLVEAADGRLGVANYRVNDTWFVVDAPFRRAVLVRGVGRKKLQVEIRNQRFPAS